MALKQRYVPEDHDHEGKSFRVRDKNYGNGQPIIVWGSHLTHEEAHRLKERVCGRSLSTTARIENMDVPLVPGAVTPRGQALSNEAPRDLPAPQPRSALVTPHLPKHPDPAIATAQAKAMAAARASAAQSQARAAAPSLVSIPGVAPDTTVDEVIEVPEGMDVDAELDDLMGGDEAAASD